MIVAGFLLTFLQGIEKKMEDEKVTNISLNDGKYNFVSIQYVGFSSVDCLRYNESWRSFKFDNAVNALFDECVKVRQQRDELLDALKKTRECIINLSVDLDDDFEERWEYQLAEQVITKTEATHD